MSSSYIKNLKFQCNGCVCNTVTKDDCLPAGWVEVRPSPEAKFGSSGHEAKHLCPTCVAWATVTLWDDERKRAVLHVMSERGIEEWGLAGESKRLASGR